MSAKVLFVFHSTKHFRLFSVICWKFIRLFVENSFGYLLLIRSVICWRFIRLFVTKYPVICAYVQLEQNLKVDKKTFESGLTLEREGRTKNHLVWFRCDLFQRNKIKNLVKLQSAEIQDARNKSKVFRNVNFLCATNCAKSRFPTAKIRQRSETRAFYTRKIRKNLHNREKSRTFALAFEKQRHWCHSSVGRAKDWKSLCPRFDSWWHHCNKQESHPQGWLFFCPS